VNGITADIIALSRAAAANIPDETVTMVRLCWLDWFGVAIAGANEPSVNILRAQALSDGAHPVASVVRAGKAFSARQAALINATTGHALDYDDVNLAMRVHPTTVILPAVLALAEKRNLSAMAAVKAFVCGYEAAGILGDWMPGTIRADFMRPARWAASARRRPVPICWVSMKPRRRRPMALPPAMPPALRRSLAP
jgi:2-methylcitrate dehydratase PrpD